MTAAPSPPDDPSLWRIRKPDFEAAASLAAALDLSPLVGQLLLNRGVSDPAAAALYLNPSLDDLFDPYTLPDVEKAVERLAKAIESGERIFLHGDYDVDGVTSAALYLRALSALGANIIGYVPKRTDGYDLRKGGIERAREAGATLILTADCGSCAIDPIAYAKTLGIDVIVTDHHRPGSELPDAVAVVNPYREDVPRPPFRELCGAGVAFKLLDALVARISPAHRGHFRRTFVDLAALGTVADVTPLNGENRILVAHGLKALADPAKTGIRAMMAGMDLIGREVTAETISFKIAPRLNAAGRMEDADLAYRLLTTRDESEARDLAEQLDALAIRSREETARVTAEAMADTLLPEHEGRRVLVLARDAWGKGVVGVAAIRIVERCQRPVILLSYDKSTDIYHGSARSIGDFKLLDALTACGDLLANYGGHSGAAGVSVRSGNLEVFRDRMHDLAEGLVPDEPAPPTIEIDAEITNGSDLTASFVDQMNQLAPFGRANEIPTFVTHGAVVLSVGRMGKDGSHFSLRARLPGTSGAIRCVWWRGGEWADRLSAGDEVDLVYTPRINEWRGQASVELEVKDLRR